MLELSKRERILFKTIIINMREFYEAIGGNYDEVIQRLPSEALVKKFVLKFKDDPSYNDLVKAKKDNNIEAAFLAAHTLKGVAATLGFTELSSKASDLTEQLRPKQAMADDSYFKAVDEAYEKVNKELNKIEE